MFFAVSKTALDAVGRRVEEMEQIENSAVERLAHPSARCIIASRRCRATGRAHENGTRKRILREEELAQSVNQ